MREQTVRDYLMQRGLKIKGLMPILGIKHRSTISNKLNRRRGLRLTDRDILKICMFFGLDKKYFDK